MKIFQVSSKDYVYTYPENNDDYKKYRHEFNGSSMQDIWSPLEVEYINNPPKKIYDCTSLHSGALIFNQRAVHALNDLIKDKAEILPLIHTLVPIPENIFAINVINLLDCLDYEKAKIKIDDDYKTIVKIFRYAFIKDMVQGETIFKMPQYKTTRIFVTEKFVEAVKENKITGLVFEEVWDSEVDPTIERTIPIPQFEGEDCSFTEALKILNESDYAVASEGVKMQKEGEEFVIGLMDYEGKYHWATAPYFPPALLNKRWYKVERSPIKRVTD